MKRRAFLQLATAAAASFALDPERLLWVPGQRTIFLPTPRPFALVGEWVVSRSRDHALVLDAGGNVYAKGGVWTPLRADSTGRLGIRASNGLVLVSGACDFSALIAPSDLPVEHSVEMLASPREVARRFLNHDFDL